MVLLLCPSRSKYQEMGCYTGSPFVVSLILCCKLLSVLNSQLLHFALLSLMLKALVHCHVVPQKLRKLTRKFCCPMMNL